MNSEQPTQKSTEAITEAIKDLRSDSLIRACALLIIFYLVGLTLIQTRDIILPIITAITIWFLISKIVHWVSTLPILRRWVPHWLAIIIAVSLILSVVGGITHWIASSLNGLAPKLPEYQANLSRLITSSAEALNLTLPNKVFESVFSRFDLSAIATSLASSFGNAMSNISMVMIYVLFIFMDQAKSTKKIAALFPEQARRESIILALDKMSSRIQTYLSIKTMTSLLTAGLSYAAMRSIDLDHAPVWALAIFMLNYIPTIGSIAGIAFPVIMAVLQFGDLLHPLIMLTVVSVIQLFTSNYLEPKLMGATMNISPTIIVISMVVFGAMWGLTGMILSVPMLVIFATIMAAFENTRAIAILLSEDGSID